MAKKRNSATTAENPSTPARSSVRASARSSSTTKTTPSKFDSGVQTEKLGHLTPRDTYHLTDGEWVPIGAFRHHVCCGCGMEHRVETRIDSGVMQERWTTTKEPRQHRRSRKGN